MRRQDADHAHGTFDGDITVATLWLVFYLAVVFIAVSLQADPFTIADMS